MNNFDIICANDINTNTIAISVLLNNDTQFVKADCQRNRINISINLLKKC